MIKAISLAVLVLGVSSVYAQETVMSVSPNTCVALKKGQVCYQLLRIKFSTPNASDFCLRSNDADEPLQCWSNRKAIEYRYRFASNRDIEFEMVDRSGLSLADVRVTLVWVYKQSRKRNRWRLF